MAKREVQKRIEALHVLKIIDQFNLIKKLLLNKNQCYMLEKRERSKVINFEIKSVLEENQEFDEIEMKNKSLLKEYLLKKKAENSLETLDVLLFKYMDESISTEINTEVNIDFNNY